MEDLQEGTQEEVEVVIEVVVEVEVAVEDVVQEEEEQGVQVVEVVRLILDMEHQGNESNMETVTSERNLMRDEKLIY